MRKMMIAIMHRLHVHTPGMKRNGANIIRGSQLKILQVVQHLFFIKNTLKGHQK